MLYLAAAASMIFGSVVALRQTDMKRLLAYTGIHNAGFMLIPLLYGRADQMGVVLYYLTFYGVAAILSLIVYAELKKHLGITSISGLQGLFYKEKAVAVALTLALLSFAGMPPLAGFWGKLGILSIGLQGGILPLMIVAIVTSVVGAYNYVRIMASMLSESTGEDYNLVDFPSEFKLFLYIVSAILVLSGLFPDVIIRMF
jgi:NADH-quinone oxidoreductase subunit N